MTLKFYSGEEMALLPVENSFCPKKITDMHEDTSIHYLFGTDSVQLEFIEQH